MLILELYEIGNRLQIVRKERKMTQWDVAELAGISSRTYADLERGTVNPRLNTLLKICQVLRITPNDILVAGDTDLKTKKQLLWKQLETLPKANQEFALQMLDLYIQASLKPMEPF